MNEKLTLMKPSSSRLALIPPALSSRFRRVCNQSSYAALRKKEGFGGEKAATCAASLPVPSIPNFSHIPCKLSRHRLSTAPHPAPAPCRTQGARHEADTPPAYRRLT